MDELELPPLELNRNFQTSWSRPPHRHQHTCTAAPLDLELVSLNSPISYTSLKDLSKSAAINSPTATAAATSFSLYEISIRNRLVKHAASAYLQPMPSSPDSSAPHCLRRVWLRHSTPQNLVADFFDFISCQVIPCFRLHLKFVN